MNKPLVSILIPAYNAVSFIEETLYSIKIQSYTNWEAIIVEDGTDDGTKDIVDTFKATVSQNVVYFKNEVNLGLPATRNVASTLAKGSWFALLDSDDLWHKHHLETLITTVNENPEHHFIYSTNIKFYDNIDKNLLDTEIEKKLKNPPYLSKNIATAIFKGYMVQPSATMFSSELFESIGGFDESFRCVEDLNFYFRILIRGYKFIYTGNSTSYYRQNPNGLSTKSIPIILTTAKIREEVLGWDWGEIDKNTMLTKTSEAWLSTARLSRKSDLKLAKYSINKAIKYRFNFKTLLFWLLIQSKFW
ncbi:glycosyltransferase family 2 protein [Neotamlana nanhaiensis]|uniref:glycosyltransferase family 2 protein n=1 Tax=Neotamlana nanhaiensis TaxID=1382798 RepID=UPI00069BB9CE|nr:glycosyltransferase family A protein [Tamlana nanhaiensis]